MSKEKLSRFLKRAFFRLGVYGLIRTLFPNRKVAILRYHAVVPPQDNFYTSPGIALSPEQFERHVRYFARRYRVLSLDEVVDALREKRPLPANCVVFTFDDGYADNFVAAEILHRYGASGTFYVTTHAVARKSRLWLAEVTYLILKTARSSLNIRFNGEDSAYPLRSPAERWQAIVSVIRMVKSNNRAAREEIVGQVLAQLGDDQMLREVENLMLTLNQLHRMREMGMIIASHTTTHLNLPNAEPEDAIAEIQEARKELESELGERVRHFSYPNSGPYAYFDERIRQYVIDAGYDSSTTSRQGFVDWNSDLFALERVRTVPVLEEVVHEIEFDRLFHR